GWTGGARRLFSEVIQQDKWYIEESDTEDAEQREREEDDVVEEGTNDPKCPMSCFSVVEKIRWWQEWRSALVVKGLGRKVPHVPLVKRLNFLWGLSRPYSRSCGPSSQFR
ncbi:unnamed protein product, partial [Linum tenue]